MKKNGLDYIITIIGLILFGSGLFLVKTVLEPLGVMRALPYICIGVGCGIFGHGLGNIVSYKAVKNNPTIQKQIEINKNDERNVTIGNRAKAKAYDMMIFIFGALMLIFALMSIDLVVILLLCLAYLFVVGYGVYYRFKFEKEM
ncbi:MAG: hypothetical protein ACOWWR_08285 [Eubacteriales bacterium]